MLTGDLVAVWEVALSDSVYRIELAHGTTTGKRVVHVNGQVSPGVSSQRYEHREGGGSVLCNQRNTQTGSASS